jgi:hypothetical protein
MDESGKHEFRFEEDYREVYRKQHGMPIHCQILPKFLT